MAINPFRVGELQLPQPLRPVPIDFSPLQSIGEGIGQYRQQQEIGSILAGATGPDGQLDLNKAATGLGAAGHVALANRLIENSLKQQAQILTAANQKEERKLQERGQDITKGHYGDVAADLEKRRGLDERRLKLDEDTRRQGNVFYRENPLGIGPGYYERVNPDGTVTRLGSGAAPTTAPPVTPPASTGPRSDVAPDVAPGGAAPTFADRFDPENAPPYQTAAIGPVAAPGQAAPPQAAPTQVAQAGPTTPAPTEANPALQQFEQQYGPDAARVMKDVLEYKRGPLHGKEEAWITAAQQVDPSYDPLQWEARQKEAKQAPRQFGVSDVEKLTEKGTNARDALRFTQTFKPEFAGPAIGGGLGIAAGRFLPEGASRAFNKDLPEASQWWQDYENYKNTIRKGTFGATLTKNELEAFNRANITAGMDPKQISTNLGRQQLLVTEAIKREANGLIAAGYDPKVISQSLGLDLKQLGVTAEGRQRGAATKSFGDVKIPMDAANDLIARSKEGDSPALRQQFDQVFGTGAADRILKRPAQ